MTGSVPHRMSTGTRVAGSAKFTGTRLDGNHAPGAAANGPELTLSKCPRIT